MTPTKNPPSLVLLRVFAILTAVFALVQAGYGLLIAFGNPNLASVHKPIGFITLALSVVAAVTAGLWAKHSGNRGLAWHGLAVAVLALVQIGLGEMHLEVVHISVGVLFLIAAAALATLALRKPTTRVAQS